MRNRPSLFEVMSKAPQTQSTLKRPKLPFFDRRPKTSEKPQALVAQALTEEEAAAELTARRAREQAEAQARAEARERVLREKEQKRQAKLERKAARQARREEAKALAAERAAERAAQKAAVEAARPKTPADVPNRSRRGKINFSFGTAGWMVTAGLVCGLLLGAYAIGRKSGQPGSEMTTAVALKPSSGKDAAPQGASDSGRAKPSSAAPVHEPEVAELLRPPAAVMQNVLANQPPRPDAAEGASPEQKRLNYVQIEWFQITVEKSSEDLRAELEDVHRFLKARGIDSFAREYARGFILYSVEGYPMARAQKPERDALLRKIRQAGQDYFRSGGRYQFKDCFFVSHKNAMKGRPVTFEES